MKACIQTDKNGDFINVNAFTAHEGFKLLGWECAKYVAAEEVVDMDPEIVFVGGIGNIRKRIALLGLAYPEQELDYPEELLAYLGRRVWETTLEELFEKPKQWNVFIKPKNETKKFTGKLVREYKDFIGLINKDKATEIWCSEPVNFITEWRCFIRYKQILDIRQYRGKWDSKLDLSFVQKAVNEFSSAPNAYSMDVGIDDQGLMKLVEINDGHSLGCYGMAPIPYAKFLSARWAELSKTKDYADF